MNQIIKKYPLFQQNLKYLPRKLTNIQKIMVLGDDSHPPIDNHTNLDVRNCQPIIPTSSL